MPNVPKELGKRKTCSNIFQSEKIGDHAIDAHDFY
jgi:hypothetical protein